MQQFNVREARNNLSKLLDVALKDEEVIIARHGTPVAMLTPVRAKTGKRILGAGRGSVTIVDEDWYKPVTGEL